MTPITLHIDGGAFLNAKRLIQARAPHLSEGEANAAAVIVCTAEAARGAVVFEIGGSTITTGVSLTIEDRRKTD